MTEAPRTISNPSSAHSKALCAIRDHSARLASLARLESEASGRSALDDAATQLFKAREQARLQLRAASAPTCAEASELAGVLERQDAVVDRFTQQLEVVGLEVQETVDQLQSHLEQTLWQSPATLQTVNLILAQAHRLAYSSFAPLELTRRQLPDVTPLPYRQPAPDVPQLQNSKLMSFAERTAKEEAVALQREMQRVREQAEKEQQQQQQQQQQGPLQPSEGTLDFLMRLGWTPGQELPKNLPDGVRRDLDAMLASFGAGAPPAAPQLPPAAAAPAQALTPDPAPVRGSADAAGSGIETTTTGDASSESEPFEDEYGLILNADAVAPDSSDDDSSVEADSD